jgi:hypothetical protein
VWFLFFAVVVFVVAVFVWDYRKKAAKRNAVSRQRMLQMIKPGAPVPAPAATTPEPAAPEAAPEAPPLAYKANERMLSQPETLLYLLLRSGIPDHEIFPKLSLAAVVVAPGTGYDREQQLRRLSRHQLDFVVCDKAMRVVAAVQLAAPGPEAVIAQRIREECLESAGIRLVSIDPAALPRRSEIRALVCGPV